MSWREGGRKIHAYLKVVEGGYQSIGDEEAEKLVQYSMLLGKCIFSSKVKEETPKRFSVRGSRVG